MEGFNIKDIINSAQLENGRELQQPDVNQLRTKLRKFQQGKWTLEVEIRDLESISETLKNELTNLQTEANELDRIQKEKEEVFKKLQLQCEESEEQSVRQLEQNKASEELLEKFRCEIQEVKLKHRKLRMSFENQLQQLIEQHKQLQSVSSPERLQVELERAQNTLRQLLSAEALKLSQLHELDMKLTELKKRKDTGSVPSQE